MGGKTLLGKLILRGKTKKWRKKQLEEESPARGDSSALVSQNGQHEQDVQEISTKEPHHQLPEELFPGGTLGITVLYTPPKLKPLVDIVLIHGLSGHSYTTWLDKRSGTFWPFDLLRKDVPNARIMTFGYDVDPANFVTAQGDLRDHAQTLLCELARERKVDPHRKLLFIVHSLGGLVTKKALCLSESSAEAHLNQVDRCTIAVAFLGTPHRGSELAPFAKGIVDILKLVNIRMNGNILEPLKRNSQVLADIEDSFSNWLRKKGSRFDLTCFYEELGLPVTGLVVTKDSAQIYGYPQISIHSNHRDMGKFASPDDSGYKRVIGEIERWLDKLEIPPDLTSLDKECLQSLSFPEMNDRGIDIYPAADGTCSWILDHKTYLSWLSQRRGLLWIKGKPGTGKSTLMKYLLRALEQHKLRSSDKTVTLSFFFHGRGSEIQRTPLGLFRSLLHQLLERFPTQLSNVVQTFKNRLDNQGKVGEKWNWRPLELQSFLEASLPKVLEEFAVRIVVDALDESGETTGLVKFFQRLRSKCSSSANNINICFSCRHFPLVSVDDGFEIRVEDENHQDIQKYIGDELRDAIEQDKDIEAIGDEILTKSSYVFQWVDLVLARALSQHNEGCSLAYIREQLRDTPTELHSLYENVFQGLSCSRDKQAQSLHLMQWICFSTRPLTLTELRFAMVTDWSTSYMFREQFQSSPVFINDDIKMEKRVKALSGGLAEIKLHCDKRVVQFIHQSVNDYITGGGLCILDPFAESVDAAIGYAQSRLSRSCIKYFAMVEIYQKMAELSNDVNYLLDEKGSVLLQEDFPFLKYSLGSWGYHARLGEEKNVSQADLVYYWFWPSPELFQAWINVSDFVRLLDARTPGKESTLLHAASLYGLTSLVRVILEEPSGDTWIINKKDLLGRSPIFYAAEEGHIDVVKFLLDFDNVDPDSMDCDDTTPLSAAAENGHINVLELLVQDERVDLNSKDDFGITPLSRAAESGHENVVRFLTQCIGIDTHLKDEYEMSVLSRAAKGGHENVVKVLLERIPVDLTVHDKMALALAARGGHYNIAKLLLESSDVDINFRIESGMTALLSAVNGGHDDVVQLLLTCDGIDVNCKDNFGSTPLMYAAEGGLENVVISLLVCSEIDVFAKADGGMTALECAADEGHENVVKLLLEYSSGDASTKDFNEQKVLFYAARHTMRDVVKQLLGSKGVDINSRDSWGQTVLSCAAEGGNEEMVELLLKYDDVDIDCLNNDGMTALALASSEGHQGVVELLKSHGAL